MLAPLAINVPVEPEQIVAEITETLGSGLTVTVVVLLFTKTLDRKIIFLTKSSNSFPN